MDDWVESFVAKSTMWKVNVSRKNELLGECAGTKKTTGWEKAENFGHEREELLFRGRRGRNIMVGGWGGVREFREKETREIVIMEKGSRLRFRHEGVS
jgi:hypothetical protein